MTLKIISPVLYREAGQFSDRLGCGTTTFSVITRVSGVLRNQVKNPPPQDHYSDILRVV